MILTTTDHDRNRAGLRYVYPVLSRRGGGLSIGINLNTNNACNWRCIYCQVPDLIRGSAPEPDFGKLEEELHYFLNDVIHGDFFERESVPVEFRRICDIALSGNGEPGTVRGFGPVIDVMASAMDKFGLKNQIKLVLITNGSMMKKKTVQAAIAKMSQLGGEVWFKVDSATPSGIRRINDARGSLNLTLERLEICTQLCPTWIQTCVFALDSAPPGEKEISAYLDFIDQSKSRGIALRGVLLYGIARPSMQAEADRLSRLPEQWLDEFARRIGEHGVEVKVSP